MREICKCMKTSVGMTILIVGLGSIGRRHLKNVRAALPQARIVVVSRSGGPHPDAGLADRVVSRLEDAVAEDPHCAIIAGPASEHVIAALTLASNGVHLLVEKPLSHTLEGVDELIAECAARQLVLMPGYTLRFIPSLNVLRQALASGRIGRLLVARAEVGQYLPDWRPGADYRQSVSARAELGGGAVLELSHEIDYLRWLAGDVKRVTALMAKVSDLEMDVEDAAEIAVEFHSGALGSISLNMLARPGGRFCRLVGETGTLEWDAIRSETRLYSAESKSWTVLSEPAGAVRNDMYRDELRHFLDCVNGLDTPRVTAADGLRALQVVVAVKQSAREGLAVTL